MDEIIYRNAAHKQEKQERGYYNIAIRKAAQNAKIGTAV
jgi:hypothetical protein